MKWDSPEIQRLIKQGLEEDAARQDITTQALIPAHLKIEAVLRSKSKGVVCGLPMALKFFKSLDPHCHFVIHAKEGADVRPGSKLVTLRGRARAILSAERSALNALQHLSGIATTTRRLVQLMGSRRTGLYDTRKTLPGWRTLQKYAVHCGGGKNHRMSLKDGVLVKENHIRLCRLVKKDWLTEVKRLKRRYPGLPVELEVQSERDLRDALKAGPNQILLDNMSTSQLRKMIRLIRSQKRTPEIEVSGGIREYQLRSLGQLGVDRISMGRLTHSAPALDISLDINRVL